jgi:membrane-bound ClpP family serine protease
MLKMPPLMIVAFVLLFVGLGLVVMEIFIPSGGVLGALAALALVLAIVLAFFCDTRLGLGFLGGVMVAIPVMVITGLHYWPRTRMGKRVMLDVPSPQDVLPDDPQRQRLKLLVGQVGRARSKMLPAGAIEIGGETIDAVSEGVAVEAGQMVRVLEVRGNRVLVRPLEATELAEAAPDLSRPIDTVGLNPFENPLG